MKLCFGFLFWLFCLYFHYAVTFVPVFSLCPLYPVPHVPPATPPHPHLVHAVVSSCPWVVHVSSLASTFVLLFLVSPCLFCSYQLCFLIPAQFSPFSLFLLPADNPPNDRHTYDSVPALVVHLVCFGFVYIF